MHADNNFVRCTFLYVQKITKTHFDWTTITYENYSLTYDLEIC